MPLNDYTCQCGKKQVDVFHKTISAVPDEIISECCGLPAYKNKFPKLGYRRDQTVMDLDDRIRWGEIQ